MDKSNTPAAQPGPDVSAGDPYILEIEGEATAEMEVPKDYASALRTYFLSGKKTGEVPEANLHPLPFAQHPGGENAAFEFPVYYDSEKDDFLSFYRLLDQKIEKHFDEVSSAIMRQELPGLFASTLQTIAEDDIGLLAPPLVEELADALKALDLPEQETGELAEKFAAFQQDLLQQVHILFGLSRKTAFQILSLQMVQRDHLQNEFLQTLKKAISGLNELLQLHGEAADFSVSQMDFAEELISFDKIRDIAISSVSSQLPSTTLTRVRSALQTLTSAQASYARRHKTIIARPEVIASFHLERLFNDARVEAASTNPCQEAHTRSQKDEVEFVRTIAALKMAGLMMEQKYDEDLHGDYFDQFNLSNLAEEDIQYLPTLLVIEHARQLGEQYNDFLRLLSHNRFVKVLAFTHLDDLYAMEGTDRDDWLELASLAVFRRNSYVFQGGVDLPADLNRAFKKGLQLPESAFWNVLIPSTEAEDPLADQAGLHAAVASRYFPRMAYRPESNHFASHQIDLLHNPDPEGGLVSEELPVKSANETGSIVSGSTVAAFLAMDPERRNTLEILPTGYENSDLIPLHEYLSQTKESLSGKIPFLWMVDEENRLIRAAVPFSWVQKSRHRLEYWAFLQSLAGINKDQVQNAIEEAKSAWETEKQVEIESLKSALLEKYEKERSAFLEQAIFRMLNGMLGEKGDIEMALTEMSQTELPPKKEEAKPEEKATVLQAEKPKAAEKEEAAPVIEEAWVESEDCTSCQDCVDALPSVFKYNKNKQAYVHDPKGGTFAQIVKAAEKCPARCIHPGVPQNKNEPSLEKWIKRAEKFN